VAARKQRPPWVPGSKDPARGSLVARGHGEPDGVPVNPLQTAVCKQTKPSETDVSAAKAPATPRAPKGNPLLHKTYNTYLNTMYIG
jgi:hypothetical protein